MRFSMFRYYLPVRGIIAGAAFASVIAGTSAGTAIDYGLDLSRVGQWLFLTALIPWMVVFRLESSPTKVTEFEAAVPANARDLLLAKCAATVLLWLAPVWAGAVLATAVGVLGDVPYGYFVNVGSAVLSTTGCIVLATVLRYRPLRRKASRLRSLLHKAFVGTLMLLGFVFPFAAVGGIAAVLAVALLWRLCTQTLASREVSLFEVSREKSPKYRMTQGAYTVHRLLVKRCLLSRRSIFFLGILFVMAVIGNTDDSGDQQWYPAVVFLVVSVSLSLQSLVGLGHLPISRSRLFRYIVVPPVLVALVGTAIGAMIGLGAPAVVARKGKLIEFDQKRDANGVPTYELLVPADLWRVATDKPPTIETPNGQSISPTAHRIGPLVVYNPYEVGYRPGTELLSFQLSRALRDCCGVYLSPKETERMYLSGRDWHLGLHQKEHPELQERTVSGALVRILLFPLLCLGALSVVFYWNVPANNRWQATRQRVGRFGAAFVYILGPFILMSMADWPYVARPDEPELLGPVWNFVGTHLTENLGLTLPIGIVLVVFAYWVQWRRYHEME